MCTRHHHQHDLIGRLQGANPMHHPRIENAPACHGLIDNLLQRFFGHAGVVFQRHGADAVAFVHVAADADETGHGTDARFTRPHGSDLGRDIEVGLLHSHLRMGWRLHCAGAHAVNHRSRVERRPLHHPP